MKIMKAVKFVIILFWILLVGFEGCKKPEPIPTTQGISGTVKDNNSGKEIEGAIVTIVGGNNTKPNYTTASDGKFSFPSQVIGNYTLEVAKTGYKTETVSLSVAVGQTTNKDVTLKRPFEISPEAGLDFGTNEKIKKFDVKNNSDKAIGFTIKVNNSWITVEPTSGTIPPNSIFPITVTVDDKGKLPATHPGSLTLNFDSNVDARNYNISMFVPNNEAPSVFSDKPTNITKTSAQVSGTITGIGKGPVTRHGHLWSDKSITSCCTPGLFTDFGPRGVGQFVSSIGPLLPGKTYYVRAYATNEKGTNLSEQEYTFTTSITTTPPDVTISSISNITTNSAKIVAKINNDGGASITSYGVVWSKRSESTTPDPRTQKTKTEIKGTPSSVEFPANIDGLEPNTEYYISAYAYNSTSTDPGIGKAISFNTPEPVTEPKLTTSATTDIDYTFVTMKGNVTDLGSVKIIEHGFVYSKSNADPKINAKNCAYKNLGNLNSATPISDKVTGLLKGMSYYYRTYVKTENGDYYHASSVKTVTTKEDNLVYYWNFNDSGFGDSTPNNINGDGSSKLTSDRFLNTNKAMDLTFGPISEIQVNRTYIPGEITVSLWTKLSESNFSGSKKVIYGHSDGMCFGNSYWTGFMVYFDPSRADGTNNILLYLSDERGGFSSTSRPIYQKSDIVLGSWQHFVFVKSGTKWRFYLDGEPVSQELSFNIDFKGLGENGSKSFLGQTWAGCSEGFGNLNGQIDDVRRYNKAFSETEVLELYNREK